MLPPRSPTALNSNCAHSRLIWSKDVGWPLRLSEPQSSHLQNVSCLLQGVLHWLSSTLMSSPPVPIPSPALFAISGSRGSHGPIQVKLTCLWEPLPQHVFGLYMLTWAFGRSPVFWGPDGNPNPLGSSGSSFKHKPGHWPCLRQDLLFFCSFHR